MGACGMPYFGVLESKKLQICTNFTARQSSQKRSMVGTIIALKNTPVGRR
jgi:hypothetical protein